MARNFKNWLKAYMEYTKYSESPDVFHFWTGVSTVAGTLQRKVWIDQRFFQWTPNFYIILVAPPGVVAKSTSSGIGSDLLWRVPGVTKGPDSATWHGLGVAFENARQLVPFGRANDPGEQEYLSMSCITCSISELGTLIKPTEDDMTMFLTDMWDGKIRPWQHTTKTSGEMNIDNPWINIIGCTTTAWMRRNFTEDMIGGGLVSRIIFVYAENKRLLNAYPADAINKEDYDAFATRLVEDLAHINELTGEYTLSADAKVWGIQWYEKHWTDRPIHMASERYSGYIARKQTHIHKLAIVLAAAQRDELRIERDDLITANRVITALEADMATVFEAIGVADVGKNVAEIVSIVRAHGKIQGGIDQQALFRQCYRTMAPKEFQEASDAAVRAGLVKIIHDGSKYVYKPVAQKKEQDNANDAVSQ